jgi:hypothetical protein
VVVGAIVGTGGRVVAVGAMVVVGTGACGRGGRGRWRCGPLDRELCCEVDAVFVVIG